MDFGTVLKTAKKISSNKNGSSFYKTKFEPPKKEPKSKTLSNNIQKFLAKKEEEERRKAEDAKRDREKFLAMRDQKTTNKIRKMLKVTKSANRSVLDDAVDTVHTAVTLHGPEQPDEDDYGYVSQEASAFYSKMMEKYKNIPEEEKFSKKKGNAHRDLSSTKDRVRAAILRQQEEELMPHKRKKRSHNADDTDDVDDDAFKSSDKRDDRSKPKRPAPPPLDFNELLKIAEKKQFEPVIIETKKPEVVEEPERLMTKKQKREYEEQRAYKEARMQREKERALAASGKSKTTHRETDSSPSLSNKPSTAKTLKIPKLSDRSNSSNVQTVKPPPKEASNLPKKTDDRVKTPTTKQSSGDRSSSYDKHRTSSTSNTRVGTPSISKRPSEDPVRHIPSKMARSSASSSNIENRPKSNINADRNKIPNSFTKERPAVSKPTGKVQDTNAKQIAERKPIDVSSVKSSINKSNREPPNSVKRLDSPRPPQSNGLNRVTQKPESKEVNVQRMKQGAPSTLKPRPQEVQKIRPVPQDVQKRPVPQGVQKPRPFPPADVQKTRQFPPPDVQKTRQFPPPDVKKSRPLSREEKLKREKMQRRRIPDDDDSEYDSSLDGFIDDGPENPEDVSGYIKEIFGYDKSRYRDVDDDDANMESNYAQVMREEYISKKAGLLEDLEDMRMEAMEKKKKMMKRRQSP